MATPEELKAQQELEKSTRTVKSLISEILDTKKLVTDDDIKRAKITRDIAKEMGTTYATAKQLLTIKEKEKSYAEQLQEAQRQNAIDSSEQVKNAKDLLEKYQKRVQREKEIDEWTSKWTDKWDDFWEIAQDPRIANGLFLIALTNEAGKFVGTLSEMSDNMGMTLQQSMELGPSMLSAGLSGAVFGVGLKKSSEAMAGLAEGAGNLKGLTGDAAVEAAKLAFNIGLTEQETGKLLARNMLITGETMAQSKASLETVANLARGASLPIGKVMKDVADNMDMMAKFGNKTVEELGKAAVEAQKMGATLSQIEAFGENIMDIDNARNKAMQLSVLLGRQINIDRAQELMYAGKETEAYKEMLNQLGGIQGFNRMDYFQRKQAAEMMGISVGELQKQLNLAAGLSETGEKEASSQSQIAAYAAKIGGYWKENGALIAAGLNSLASMKNLQIGMWIKQKAHWVAEKAHMLWKKAFGGGGAVAAAGPLTKAGAPDMRFKANKGLLGKIQKPVDSGNKLTDKMAKVPKKKGNIISRFFNSFKKVNWSSIAKGIVSMLGMAVALVAFVPPFKMLADVPVSGTLAGIGTLLVLSQTISMMGKGSSSTMKGAATMLIMAGALLPMGYSMQLIAGIPAEAMWNFTGIATVLGLVFAGIGALGGATITGAIAMILMAASMIPMAYSMQMIAGLPYADMWNFTAVLTVLGLVFSGIGYLALLPLGALGMMMMAPAMIAMAYSFQMVNGLPFADMWNFTGVLSALGLVFSILGGFPGIFVGAVALMIMGPAMIVIGYAMKSFTGLDWKMALDVGKTIGMLALTVAGIGLMGPLVIAGSVAMLVASAGLTAFGFAMQQIPTDLLQGTQMLMMAAGMGAMGIAGVAMLFGAPGFFAMSLGLFAFAGALLVIKPLLPVIEKLAELGLIGDIDAKGGEKKQGGGDEENLVVQKLDQLINLISQGGKVVMDGREVGKVINMAQGPMGS